MGNATLTPTVYRRKHTTYRTNDRPFPRHLAIHFVPVDEKESERTYRGEASHDPHAAGTVSVPATRLQSAEVKILSCRGRERVRVLVLCSIVLRCFTRTVPRLGLAQYAYRVRSISTPRTVTRT